MPVQIALPASVAQPASGRFRAGAAEAEITPSKNVPLAGYSWGSPRARGKADPLFARALYLEDAAGSAVAFCFVDLHSATRYLHARAASKTAAQGISADRLVIAGTHTHTGPGNLYGNTLYDFFAQSSGIEGFNRDLADGIAQTIATVVLRARVAAEPATIGLERRSA